MGLRTGRDKARLRMELQAEIVSFLARGGLIAELPRQVADRTFRSEYVGPLQDRSRRFSTVYGVPMQIRG